MYKYEVLHEKNTKAVFFISIRATKGCMGDKMNKLWKVTDTTKVHLKFQHSDKNVCRGGRMLDSVKSTSNRSQQSLLCGEVRSFMRKNAKDRRFSSRFVIPRSGIMGISVIILGMFLFLTACADQDLAQGVIKENSGEQRTSEVNIIEETSSVNTVYEGMLSLPVACGGKNTYDTLNVATYITKVEDMYFIADCYHDQIIYHENLTDPLNQWNVLTNEVHYAHTVASDGVMLLVDDTENNRLLAFQTTEEGYVHTQTLENIGMRPHYIQYDTKTQTFMAWSSITGEMYLIKRADEPDPSGCYPMYIDKILKLDELYGVYVRSFTIMEDGIYFVSGHNNQTIIKAAINEQGDGFELLAKYPVPDQIAGMVQLVRIDDFYYITVSTDATENQDYATILRTDSLERLASGDYEEIYDQFGISGGTPYYITEIEGRYYMAHHRTNENIIAFDINENQIEQVEVVY